MYWWNILRSLDIKNLLMQISYGNDGPREVGPEISIFMKSYILSVPFFDGAH